MGKVRYEEDGYPVFDRQDFDWFGRLVRALVPKHPEDIRDFGRRRCGLDLVLVIDVEPRSRRIFTMEVCEQLAAKVAERTGVIAPLVYVHNDPHRRAKEALDHAARGH